MADQQKVYIIVYRHIDNSQIYYTKLYISTLGDKCVKDIIVQTYSKDNYILITIKEEYINIEDISDYNIEIIS